MLHLKAFEPIMLADRSTFKHIHMRIHVRGGGKKSQVYLRTPSLPMFPFWWSGVPFRPFLAADELQNGTQLRNQTRRRATCLIRQNPSQTPVTSQATKMLRQISEGSNQTSLSRRRPILSESSPSPSLSRARPIAAPPNRASSLTASLRTSRQDTPGSSSRGRLRGDQVRVQLSGFYFLH